MIPTVVLLAVPVTLALLSPEMSSGHHSCPCIANVEQNLCQGSHRAKPDGRCYPREYGASVCASHDAGLTVECVRRGLACQTLSGAAVTCSARGGWCSSEWCWVDPAGCSLPHKPSDFFPNTSLHYSYQTCGNLDDYGPSKFVERLSSLAELRISFPGSSDSGYTVVRAGPPGYGANRSMEESGWKGSTVSFFDRVWKEYGRTRYTVAPVSESSNNFSVSSFTACVHELALGTTDACIGNFWPTPERMQLAGFTKSIYDDTFHLVVRRSRRETGLLRQLQSSVPLFFAPWEWFMLGGFLVFVSLAMWLIEGTSNEEDFPGNSVAGGLWSSVFYQLQSFLGMGDYRYTPHTNAGRIVLVATSLVFLVALTHLTAMMTADEVRVAQVVTEFQELDDLIKHQKQICGLAAAAPIFARTYPGAQALYVPLKSASEVLAGIDAGMCAGGILTEDAWRTHKGMAAHCNKVRLPATLHTQDNAFAMRDDLTVAFSWAMDKLKAEYIHFKEQAQHEVRLLDECVHVQEEEASEVVARVSVMLLPTFCSTVAVALALLWYAVDDTRSARKRSEDDPFAIPSLAERLFGRGRGSQRRPSLVEPLTAIRDRDADVRMVRNIFVARRDFHSHMKHKIKDNAPITISDVPMLVHILARAVAAQVGLAHAAHRNPKDATNAEDVRRVGNEEHQITEDGHREGGREAAVQEMRTRHLAEEAEQRPVSDGEQP